MDIIKTKFELYTLNIANIWDPVEDKNFWEATIEIPDNGFKLMKSQKSPEVRSVASG